MNKGGVLEMKADRIRRIATLPNTRTNKHVQTSVHLLLCLPVRKIV
ncbi:MAG: hypothetical protein JWQ90_2566 [Hydrocarboniphaga sp.]|nr:hypothetical protein [Hydrocarboniphaga sp.]